MYLVNTLLDRRQFVLDLTHSGRSVPWKEVIKDLVAEWLKAKREFVVIFGPVWRPFG
jgi:ribosomal protein S24E